MPIILTWIRVLLIPITIGIFYLPSNILSPLYCNFCATLVFITAALTDWFDGFLARRLNQTSAFGAFLDPVADKLMIATALLLLVQFGRINALIALIVIGREITISALREWMAKIGASKRVAVTLLGKIKTVCQMIAISILLIYGTPTVGNVYVLPIKILFWGKWLMYLSVLLTIWSMLNYLKLAWPQLRKSY